jgi:FkbM family methyltransferase
MQEGQCRSLGPGAARLAELTHSELLHRACVTIAKMLDRVILHILGCIPVALRRRVIRNPENPSRAATFVHKLLNFRPPAQEEVFTCRGPLEGCRMHIDWKRFRSFVYGTWEPDVVSAIVSALKPGMTAIDVGAHIGYYTILFAKCVGPTGQVLSLEPFPANFGLLQKNVQLNQLQQVQTFPKAVFSRTGELTISVPDDLSDSGNASVVHNQGAKQFHVSAITLDSLHARPDFLKVDVEGAEYDVLLGGKETIARSRPKMLIELHHFDGDLARHPVPRLLASWEYQIQWVDRFRMTSHILAWPLRETS